MAGGGREGLPHSRRPLSAPLGQVAARRPDRRHKARPAPQPSKEDGEPSGAPGRSPTKAAPPPAASRSSSRSSDGDEVLGSRLQAADSEASEAKPWHVPDEQVEELVQVLKQQDESFNTINTSLTGSSALKRSSGSASLSASLSAGELVRKKPSPSCGCRAMLAVGRVQAIPDYGPLQAIPDHLMETGSMSPKNGGWVSPRCLSVPDLEGGRRRSASTPGQRRASRTTSTPSRGKADPVVEIDIYMHERSDRLTLELPASTRVGPDVPPPVTSLQQEFMDWKPGWSTSLKDVIEQATGVEASKQQLFHRGSRMASDRRRLRDYHIQTGQTITVRTIKEAPKRVDREVRLSSTKLRQEKEEAKQEQDHKKVAAAARCPSGSRPGTPGSGVRVMPKWQPSSPLKWFGTTGGGLDSYGDSKTVTHTFGDYHTWHPCHEDTDGLFRLRQSAVYTSPVQYVPQAA